MDWDRVEGNWKLGKDKVKEQWGKLTDDDLDVLNRKQNQLEGRLQQRYGSDARAWPTSAGRQTRPCAITRNKRETDFMAAPRAPY
jgi:uncharacterized protein YjbJ (UPF0337 family)